MTKKKPVVKAAIKKYWTVIYDYCGELEVEICDSKERVEEIITKASEENDISDEDYLSSYVLVYEGQLKPLSYKKRYQLA